MSNDNKITKTNDGYVVELFAKSKKEITEEIIDVSEGVCLLDIVPSKTEEQQFLIYKEIVEKMEDSPVIIKTLEKGKDEELLKVQLKALLRAGKYGDLSVVFPKISTVEELKEYKDILEVCKVELKVKDIPYKNHIKAGIVVEMPSAALTSYELSRECDFLFIETNSLTNYIFGKNTIGSKTAIIKLIKETTEGAHDAGIFCGICGDIVEDELYIPLLIGLGIDEFSMDSKKITKVREVISKLDKYDCKELAEEVFALRSFEEIEKKLKQF